MRLLALLLLAAPPALAQEPEGPSVDLAEEADLHFRVGVRHYRNRNYEAALEHLLVSNRLVPNRNVQFNIGRCYEQLERYSEAYRHYSDYTAYEKDPAKRKNGEEAIARIQARIALIRITSNPPGATVYIDRKNLGQRGHTPQDLALPAGTHTVLLELDGHEPAQTEAELVIGKAASVTLDLRAILGKVRVQGTPAGAEIRVGDTDEVLGTLPATLDLPPGPHVLVVSAPGHQDARQIVEIAPDQTSEAVVDLSLMTGRLLVDAHLRDAVVEIDGQAAGFTPAALDVPAGERQIRVTYPGYRPFEQTLDIPADESTSLDVRLRSLNEVTAASRTAMRVEDAPASVTLITQEEIRAFAYQDLYDALAGSRGVYGTNDLTYRYLGIRGFSRPGDYGNRLLTTLDGHTMNDDQLGASYVGSDAVTDLSAVRQIELVRGPGSALYGSNAFFGVVNMVTHDHDQLPAPRVTLTADKERLLRASAGGGTGDAARGTWLQAGILEGQGRDYFFRPFTNLPRGQGGHIRNADSQSGGTLQGQGWWGPVTAQGFFHTRTKRIPDGTFESAPGDERAFQADTRAFGELRYEPELSENTKLYSRAWVDHYAYRGQFPYGNDYIYMDFWDGYWVGGEPRLVTSPVEAVNLTLGGEVRSYFDAALESLEYSQRQLDRYERTGVRGGARLLDEDPTFTTASGYGNVELVPGQAARFTLGARYDFYDLPKGAADAQVGALSPRAAVVLNPSEADTIKLLGGRAFRAPSPYEYFYNDDAQTQVPPVSLSPETILTTELEATHRFSEVTSLVLGGFFNRLDGLIDTQEVPSDPDLFRYFVTKRPTHSAGIESELRREWRDGWMFAGQVSAQRTRIGPLDTGTEVMNSPPVFGAVKAAAPIVPGVTTAASRLIVEAPRLDRTGQPTDPAVLWDLTLSGDVPNAPVSYAVGWRNLLDWKVRHPVGLESRLLTVPQPGRSVFASVTASM